MTRTRTRTKNSGPGGGSQQALLFPVEARVDQDGNVLGDRPVEGSPGSLSRRSDPVTSRLAAERVAGSVAHQQQIVRTWLREWFAVYAEPPTTWELAVFARPELAGNPRATPEMLHAIIHRRVRGMERAGLVIECEKRLDRFRRTAMLTWRLADGRTAVEKEATQ